MKLDLTPEEAKVFSSVVDKFVQHILRDALTEIVTPAIKNAMIRAVGEIVAASAKPGGGQEGGSATETKQSEE